MIRTMPERHLASTSASAAAFEEVKPELLALEPADYVTLNVDPRTVARAMLVSLGNAKPYMDLVAQLPLTDHALIAKLETYALALGHAHAVHALTVDRPKIVQPSWRSCGAPAGSSWPSWSSWRRAVSSRGAR